MKRKLILVGASVFAMSGVIHLAQARDFVDFSQLCGTTVDTDTQVKRSGDFNIAGDCTIEVDDAKLEIVGVKINVAGELRIDDVSDTDSGEASGLVIQCGQFDTGVSDPGWCHGAGNEKHAGIQEVIANNFKGLSVMEVDRTTQYSALQGGAAISARYYRQYRHRPVPHPRFRRPSNPSVPGIRQAL